MADAARRRITRAIVDITLGDDGITIHEHPDGNFTIDVGSERCILDPETFRDFIHQLAMFGRQKGWIHEQPLDVTYALPPEPSSGGEGRPAEDIEHRDAGDADVDDTQHVGVGGKVGHSKQRRQQRKNQHAADHGNHDAPKQS